MRLERQCARPKRRVMESMVIVVLGFWFGLWAVPLIAEFVDRLERRDAANEIQMREIERSVRRLEFDLRYLELRRARGEAE